MIRRKKTDYNRICKRRRRPITPKIFPSLFSFPSIAPPAATTRVPSALSLSALSLHLVSSSIAPPPAAGRVSLSLSSISSPQIGKEVAIGMEESGKKFCRPQLVKLDKALKLAEQWVSNMTKSTEDKSAEVELEGRPPRLGIGAVVPRQSKVGPSNYSFERKLHAKLDAGKRKAAKSTEDSSPSERDTDDGKDDEDEYLDSRTNAFAKKREPLTSSLQLKKKQK